MRSILLCDRDRSHNWVRLSRPSITDILEKNPKPGEKLIDAIKLLSSLNDKVIKDILKYIEVRGEIFFCTRFSVSPTRMTGRGHECCCRLCSDCREIGEMFGSEKSAAVAGTIRGIKNDPARADENTDNTVAPLRPPTRPPTSPATIGFWKYI